MKNRVLFLIPTLDRGGAENVLLNLVNNMDHSKFDITVQTLFDMNSQKNELNPNISYKTFMNRQFKGNSKLFARIPSKWLFKIIVKEQYDIVVSYLEGPTTHILSGCPYKETKRVAWIHVELGSDTEWAVGFTSKKKALDAYESFDKIVYVAETVKTQFEKTGGKRFPQGVVLYNAVNSKCISQRAEEPIEEIAFSKDEINIISVGRVIPMKGYDRLARIHRQLIGLGIKHHIYIIGKGPQQSEIEQYLTENDLSQTFTFLGFKDNPYKYVSQADLFVCSSRREGFSTAVTESLIVGTPVVSTNCSGANELLGKNNEYGIVTENDEEALYEGIKSLLDHPEMLAQYKEKAKERGKMFSTEKTVNAVEDMLNSLVQ